MSMSCDSTDEFKCEKSSLTPRTIRGVPTSPAKLPYTPDADQFEVHSSYRNGRQNRRSTEPPIPRQRTPDSLNRYLPEEYQRGGGVSPRSGSVSPRRPYAGGDTYQTAPQRLSPRSFSGDNSHRQGQPQYRNGSQQAQADFNRHMATPGRVRKYTDDGMSSDSGIQHMSSAQYDHMSPR